MAELLGQHRYQLDAKGRIALPVKFREAFGEGLYLTLGQDGCLYVFPKDEFERQASDVRSRPLSRQAARDYARMFFGNAERADIDGQGRLTIPQRLRTRVGLDREAVVIGVFDHLEVWASGAWDSYERDRAGAYSSGALDIEGR